METDQVGLTPVVLSVLVLMLAELAAGFLMQIQWRFPLLVLGGIRLAEIVLFLLVFRIWGRGPADLGLGRDQILPGLIRGILWSLGFGGVVLAGFALLWLTGVNPLKLLRTGLPRDPVEKMLLFTVGGVIGPVAEELFFRGVLYGYFRQWGIFAALFLSSMIFVLAHPVNSFPFTQLVGGLLFALAYEIEGKLTTPITIHVLGNLALFSLPFLQ